jgi:hypothetical protein
MHDAMTEGLTDDRGADELEAGAGEPRGPHLPDVLAAVPFGTWFFGLLAFSRLIWFVRETHLGPAPEPSVLLAYVGGLVPAVVAVLLPAVLLLRHPDAWTTARSLLLGTVLLAVVEGMRAEPGTPAGLQIGHPGQLGDAISGPLALIYSSAQALLATYAVASVGLGLAGARRYMDRSGTPLIVAVAGAIVVIAAAARVIVIARLPFDEIPMTPTVAVYLASAIVLSVLSIGAWGYLAATSVRGARAGEDPEAGWAIGAIGAWLILAAFVVSAVVSLIEPTPETQGLYTTLGQGISVIHTLGYLALLGGLLLGLPSLEPLDAEEDEDAETDDPDETYAEVDTAAGSGEGAAGDVPLPGGSSPVAD